MAVTRWIKKMPESAWHKVPQDVLNNCCRGQSRDPRDREEEEACAVEVGGERENKKDDREGHVPLLPWRKSPPLRFEVIGKS